MRIKKYAIETLIQIVIWGILLLIEEEIIILLNVKGFSLRIQILYYLGIPIIVGTVFCLIKNKAYASFHKKITRQAVLTLLIRVSVVVILLILGYILQSLNTRNWLSIYLNGKYTRHIASFVSSISVYIIISFFPLAYGVTYFLFVSNDK